MSDGMGSFDGIRKANERAARLEQSARREAEGVGGEAGGGSAQADAAKKVAAGGEQPYKRTIKMTSTASRKRARQAEADAAAAAEAAAQDTMMLSREDGETIKWGKARLEIVDQVIKNRPGYAEVTIDEIRKETRINLHANREALERLCNDPWVDVYDDGEGIRFRYRPMHGIRDRESLEHVLQRARADGIRQNDIEKAYDGVQEDIQRMVKAGIVIKVQASDQVFKKAKGRAPTRCTPTRASRRARPRRRRCATCGPPVRCRKRATSSNSSFSAASATKKTTTAAATPSARRRAKRRWAPSRRRRRGGRRTARRRTRT